MRVGRVPLFPQPIKIPIYLFCLESIFDIFKLPDSQIYRKAEFEMAEAAQDTQGTFEARLGHVAPGLVVWVYERPRLTQQVEPGHKPLLIERHAH